MRRHWRHRQGLSLPVPYTFTGPCMQKGADELIAEEIVVSSVTIRGSEIIGGLRETTHGDTT